MMRVAHVITRMIIGGAQENTLFNCLDLIRDYQDEVLLITGPAFGPEGELLSQGRAAGLKVVMVDPLRRAIHPWRDYVALREIRYALREFGPDVVHTHSAKGGFLGRAAGWSLKGPVVVHTVHGAPFHPYQSFFARNAFILLERWAARRCHHIISVADAMTDLMVKARVAPLDKFTTIYSGMDVEPFVECAQSRATARTEFGFRDEDIVFGKIARFFNLKGHEYLIEAAKNVVAANPNCKFLLVGDGILRDEHEAAIRSNGLESHFVLTGLVPPERVPYCLSAMDCLVHTSLREGLARTIPQALIASKPVISYDIDGAREVVLTGETGFLLPPRSIDELSEAMLQLAGSQALRNKFGQCGAERFTDQFRHRSMTQRIRDLYVQLCAREAVKLGK